MSIVNTAGIRYIESKKIICDGYGIGTVEEIYASEFQGVEQEFIKLNFDNLKMNYTVPLSKLKFRYLEKPSKIKSLFKLNIQEKATALVKLNFNLQQMKMTNMLNEQKIEDIVFVLRYLDSKKRHSIINSLCSFDDTLYRKLLSNLSEELAVGLEKPVNECLVELRQLLEKNQVHVPVISPTTNDDEELEDFE